MSWFEDRKEEKNVDNGIMNVRFLFFDVRFPIKPLSPLTSGTLLFFCHPEWSTCWQVKYNDDIW
jgi:hypothetical protein